MRYSLSNGAALVVDDDDNAASPPPYTSASADHQKWRSSLRRIRHPPYRSSSAKHCGRVAERQTWPTCHTSRLLYIALFLYAFVATTTTTAAAAAAATVVADSASDDGGSATGDLAAVEQTTSICVEYPRLSLCQLRPMLENALTEIDFLVNGIGLVNSQGASEGIYTDIRPVPDDTVSSIPSAVILQSKMRRRRSGASASASSPLVRHQSVADGRHIAAFLMSGSGDDDDASSSAKVDASMLRGDAESAMPANLWRRIRVEKAKKRKEK